MTDNGMLSLLAHLPSVTELLSSTFPGVAGTLKDGGLTSSFNCTASLMMFMSVFVFVASTVNKNYSWVDRSWSILPVVYTWIHMYYTLVNSGYTPYPTDGKKPEDLIDYMPTFVVVMFNLATRKIVFYALLIAVWGIRLTYNFARKGGYRRGGEDYRWNHVLTWPIIGHPLVWPFFNLFFISFFQSALLWALALPLIALPATAIVGTDLVMGSFFLFFFAMETITDQQQWNFFLARKFGNRLYAAAKAKPPQQRYLLHDTPEFAPGVPSSLQYDTQFGFCYEGAFAYSRHLNVFSEQSMWVTIGLAGWLGASPMSTTGAEVPMWFFYAGAILLIAITGSSTLLTEYLSSTKYPAYRQYKSTTPMLIPSMHPTNARTRHVITRAQQLS